MAEPRYLRVRNWPKFQHYKDREPAWIKNYINLDDPSHPFSKLSYADQGRLQKLWRLAAKLDNRIPYDPVYLGRVMGMKAAAIQRTIDGYLADKWLQSGSQEELKRMTNAEKRGAKRKKTASAELEKPSGEACLESREQRAEKEIVPAEGPADFKFAVELKQLLDVVAEDADAGTSLVLRRTIEKHRLPLAALVEAREAAARPGTRNRAKVASAILQGYVKAVA